MRIFAKWLYGFDPARWPAITFATAAARDKLLREAKPGDTLVFIGTQGDETAEADRGKVLGMAIIGRRAADTLSLIDPAQIPAYQLDDNNRHRWPKAIPMLRAWRFPKKPSVKDVLGRQLPQNARIQAVRLTDDQSAAVLALHKEEVPLPQTDERRHQHQLTEALSHSGPTRGPVPANWSARVTRSANEPAFTYALRFGHRDIWKIGHAKDVIGRLAEVNKHIPTEVLRECWEIVYQHRWPTEIAAHDMDQNVLAKLQQHRTSGERVGCTREILLQAWQDCLGIRSAEQIDSGPNCSFRKVSASLRSGRKWQEAFSQLPRQTEQVWEHDGLGNPKHPEFPDQLWATCQIHGVSSEKRGRH